MKCLMSAHGQIPEADPFLFFPLLQLVNGVSACFPMMTFRRDSGNAFVMILPQEHSPRMAYLFFLSCVVFFPVPFFPSCALLVCCLPKICSFLSRTAFASLLNEKWQRFLFRLRDTEYSQWFGCHSGWSLCTRIDCQFKLASANSILNSDRYLCYVSLLFSPTLVLDSQVFWLFRIPKCFHG